MQDHANDAGKKKICHWYRNGGCNARRSRKTILCGGLAGRSSTTASSSSSTTAVSNKGTGSSSTSPRCCNTWLGSIFIKSMLTNLLRCPFTILTVDGATTRLTTQPVSYGACLFCRRSGWRNRTESPSRYGQTWQSSIQSIWDNCSSR